MNKEPRYKRSKHTEELLGSQASCGEGIHGSGGVEVTRDKMELGCENPE